LALPGVAAMAADCDKGEAAAAGAIATENVAAEGAPAAAAAALQTPAVNVGNKICPVSGDAIGSMGVPATVEYEGKIYNICCVACAKTFNSDPQKYIAIINTELEASKEGL
jgi:YHS domain-containing protein